MSPATQQVVYGLALLLPSSLLGYLSYRRSKKVDAISAQAGVSTETRAGTAQIIEGLNQLVDQLQDDNKSFRDDIRYLTSRLDGISTERDELRRQLNRLHRKYGENGNGTSDSPG